MFIIRTPFLQSAIYIYCDMVVSSIAVAIVSLSLIVEIKHTIQRSKRQQPKWSQYVTILALLSLVCFLITCLGSLLSCVLNPTGNSYLLCRLIFEIAGTVYTLGKAFTYGLMLLRSYAIYKNTAYAYNKRRLLFFLVYMVIASAGTIFQGIFLSSTYTEHLDSYDLWLCQSEFQLWGMLWTAVHDTILNFWLTYLCVQRLWVIVDNINDFDNPKKRQLLEVGIKITLLSVITIMTSFAILGVIGLLGVNWLLCIDCAVNSICIVLMSARSEVYYQYCCGMCAVHIKTFISKRNPNLLLQEMSRYSVQLDSRKSQADTQITASNVFSQTK